MFLSRPLKFKFIKHRTPERLTLRAVTIGMDSSCVSHATEVHMESYREDFSLVSVKDPINAT